MYVLFKVRSEQEMYFTGEYDLRTGKPKTSKDLTKSMPFKTKEQAYAEATIDGLLDFRVGRR